MKFVAVFSIVTVTPGSAAPARIDDGAFDDARRGLRLRRPPADNVHGMAHDDMAARRIDSHGPPIWSRWSRRGAAESGQRGSLDRDARAGTPAEIFRVFVMSSSGLASRIRRSAIFPVRDVPGRRHPQEFRAVLRRRDDHLRRVIPAATMSSISTCGAHGVLPSVPSAIVTPASDSFFRLRP